MAAITPTIEKAQAGVKRHYGTSAANQSDTLSTEVVQRMQELIYVGVRYSAAPTQTGVLVDIDSGISSSFDTRLSTGTANAQNNTYAPSVPVPLFPGDQIIVTAPAAGGVITGSIVIVTRDIG